MFKVGSIRKIVVENFVTYSYAELYPAPNLNMIIGPNGTGKSTIVAAIILGLGGTPKVVGRGVKVSEYVKHNCDKATIQIYLQGERENEFTKVTRIFNIQDKTSWFLNNQPISFKDLMDHIKVYRIQVENLCQFLPQDRVQDFAKMNQQQLLKETQIALCRNDLIEKQQVLLNFRENDKLLRTAIEKNNEKLQENRDVISRLEGKIENFARKKQFLNKIRDIDRKIAWMEYDKIYEKMLEVKTDLKKAKEIYEKHQNTIKPIESKIQAAKQLISELQHSNSKVTKSLRENENFSRNLMEKIERTKEKTIEIEREMNEKLAFIAQKNQEIETISAQIKEMKVSQKEFADKCGNDEEIQQKINKITNEIQKFRRHVTDIQNQKDTIVERRQTKTAELRMLENKIRRLEDVKQERLNYLQRINRDAYEAVLWLRQNKHLFKHELNVLDSKNAIYVENVIPMRDRIAFTCVDKTDMNNLIRYLRIDKKLTVNILWAGTDSQTQIQPTIPIEQLRRYGFYTYLYSLFTAPEPIKRYLCRTYRVHNIPIGTKEIGNYIQDLPQKITTFFSDSVKYSVSYSIYTNAKSVRQNEIQSDGGFSISMDVLYLESLRGQSREIKNQVVEYENEMKEYDTQIVLINEKIVKISDEVKHFYGIKQQAQIVGSRIATMQKKIDELRQMPSDEEAIRTQARMKIKKVVCGMRQLVLDLKKSYTTLTRLTVQHELNSVKIAKARQNAGYLENQNQELRQMVRDSETTMNQVKESYNTVRGQAKAILQKAKSLSNNFTPEDEGFEVFREAHENLSSDFNQLQEEKQELSAKIECLNTANDEEMKEYEDRVQAIKELQETIERAQVDLSKTTSKMVELQKEWIGPLTQLVTEVNAKFASAFEKMGCAGEVSINRGNDEKDFSEYGLCIKVTYRNGEPLQELNSVVQSGGERAVATAVFMLSLQELTPVPFRCVDEINQGMDVNNERRIFDLLVESTSKENTAQYFLITPKLVPDLKYSRTTMVHVVHNGPFVDQDKKWNMSVLCNPQRVQIH